jgi:hypothetical protein
LLLRYVCLFRCYNKMMCLYAEEHTFSALDDNSKAVIRSSVKLQSKSPTAGLRW